MKDFILILFNRTFNSVDVAKDRVLRCDDEIYNDIKDYRADLHEDYTYLNAFVEKSCSLLTKQHIDAIPFPRTVLISDQNDMVNMLKQYNNTDFGYQHIAFNNTADVSCHGSSESWSNWISSKLESLYHHICTDTANHCRANHHQKILSISQQLISSIDRTFCHHDTTDTTANPSISFDVTNNIDVTNNYYSNNTTSDDDSNGDMFIYGVIAGAAIFLTGYCTQKIINYVQRKYCIPNPNDNTDLQELTVLTGAQVVLGTPKDAIQMHNAEHSIEEPLYENIDTMGNTGSILD